jgi:hypothetical protein
LKNGHRFLANEGDENTLKQLVNAVKEQVGRSGFVRKGEDGRNVFIFNEIEKL